MFRIVKTDADQRLVFGYASVSVRAGDDTPLVDLHGHLIDPADLELAAYAFVLKQAGAKENHDGPIVGQLVESFMVTPEKLAAMGLSAGDAPQAGWWVGFKVSPETFAKVKDGTFTMLSIAGTADEIEA
jgi:hypothetical protein